MAVRVWCVGVMLALSCGQAGAGVLDELNGELAKLVKAAAPSVVEICGGGDPGKKLTESLYKLGVRVKGSEVRDVLTIPRVQVDLRPQSVGSGFVIDAAGYILTTSDVARAEKVTVKFSDGTQAEGKVLGRDDLTDVAVIKVEKSGLKALPLGDSESLEVGNLVVSVNNQSGLASTVSLGVVAGLNRKMDQAQDLIQISGTIGPGASGGPVLDARGRVVGVTFAMLSPSPSALPFNYPRIIIGGSGMTLEAPGNEEHVQAAAKQLLAVKEQELKGAEARKKLYAEEAARAEQLYKQGLSPEREAQEANLKLIDSETVLAKTFADLENAKTQIELVQKATPFAEDYLQAARLTTRTSGSSGFAIPINRIKSILDDLKAGKSVERGWLGAMLDMKDSKIIFKDLEKGEPAEEAGLKAGDVLVSVDGKRFDEIKDFTSYVTSRKPGEVIKIVVSREGKECEVSAKLGKRPSAPEVKKILMTPRIVSGGTFSLSLEDAGIAEIAKKLSDASGVSVIVSEPEKIKKRVTVHLKSTTAENALDVICRTLGCQYKKDGDAYVVSPR